MRMHPASAAGAVPGIEIGDFKLSSLDDGSFAFPADMFFANVPEPVWRAELAAGPDGKIPVGHNCGLVRAGRELILVDTGYGDDSHGGRTGHLLDALARAGHAPGDVTLVVNTHAHGDHAGRNTVTHHGNPIPAFPHARYFLAYADWRHFDGPAGEVHHFRRNFGTLARCGVLTLFDGPFQLAPGVTVLPTPGHTPGHASLLLASRGAAALCLGDVCHHPLHVAHPGWVSRFDTDPLRTPHTRAWLFAWALEHAAVILCPHASAPGLGRIVRAAGGFAWRALD